MNILTTYETVKERYTEQLEEIEKKLRAGKSKHKNADMSSLTYNFRFAVTVPFEKRPTALEGYVAFQVKNTCTVIRATIGQAWYDILIDNPIEVTNWHTTSFLEQQKEKERYDSLSNNQKKEEFEKALKSLKKGSGFVII